MLLDQMKATPKAILTTPGPELSTLGSRAERVCAIPYLFSWWGKFRWWNPVRFFYACAVALGMALRLRPRWVVSLGASDVVPFCYAARLLGAEIIHVECMNQVVSRSLTGRLLYPIAKKIFVQWEDLRPSFGSKAEYAGWVL